jgi:hypothetical protein
MTYKSLYSQSWYFFRSNIVLITMITLPWVFLSEVASLLLLEKMGDEINKDIMIIAHAAIAPFYLVPLLLVLFSRNNNVPLQQKNITNITFKKWLPIAICTLFISLVTHYLIYFFVLPAAWLASRLSYSYFYIVFAHQPPFTAVINSFKATQKIQWPLFFVFALAIVFKIMLMVSLMLSEITWLVLGINMIELLMNTGLHIFAFFLYVVSFRAWSVMQVSNKVNSKDKHPINKSDKHD